MHFEVIKDYRQAAKVEYKLSDIILLTICDVLSGFDTWEGICDFGESRTDFLKSSGDFENGILSSDTITRVMGMVSPSAMQKGTHQLDERLSSNHRWRSGCNRW